jgi:hypothetical protein
VVCVSNRLVCLPKLACSIDSPSKEGEKEKKEGEKEGRPTKNIHLNMPPQLPPADFKSSSETIPLVAHSNHPHQHFIVDGYSSTVTASPPPTALHNTDNNVAIPNTATTVTTTTTTIPTTAPSELQRTTTPRSSQRRVIWIKTSSSRTFWEDLHEFRPGSIPHSMIHAVTIGTVCGVAAYLYYAVLEWMLTWCWHTLPSLLVLWLCATAANGEAGANNSTQQQQLSDNLSSSFDSVLSSHNHPFYVLWIPFMGFFMALGVGLTVRFLGEVCETCVCSTAERGD